MRAQGPSPENRLYLFQFPTLFPKFTAASSGTGEPSSEASDGAAGASGKARRSVAFTEDAIAAKNKDGSSKEVKKESGEAGDAGRQRPEGQAGRLELYNDGRVAMRFGDVVMEVSASTVLLRRDTDAAFDILRSRAQVKQPSCSKSWCWMLAEAVAARLARSEL